MTGATDESTGTGRALLATSRGALGRPPKKRGKHQRTGAKRGKDRAKPAPTEPKEPKEPTAGSSVAPPGRRADGHTAADRPLGAANGSYGHGGCIQGLRRPSEGLSGRATTRGRPNAGKPGGTRREALHGAFSPRALLLSANNARRGAGRRENHSLPPSVTEAAPKAALNQAHGPVRDPCGTTVNERLGGRDAVEVAHPLVRSVRSPAGLTYPRTARTTNATPAADLYGPRAQRSKPAPPTPSIRQRKSPAPGANPSRNRAKAATTEQPRLMDGNGNVGRT